MIETSTTTPLPRPAVKRRRLGRALAFLVAATGTVLSVLWYIGVFGGNFHAVVPGRVYRSAQLTGHNLDEALQISHAKTVINLRGGSPSDAWYQSELASCRQAGAKHIDITMSARRLPDPRKLQMVMTAFDTAKYPVLYHCSAGSDRTGLVSALYLNVYKRMPLDQAQREGLTWRYGHISWGETHAMDDFFTMYRQTGHGKDLRSWITTDYPKLYAASKNR